MRGTGPWRSELSVRLRHLLFNEPCISEPHLLYDISSTSSSFSPLSCRPARSSSRIKHLVVDLPALSIHLPHPNRLALYNIDVVSWGSMSKGTSVHRAPCDASAPRAPRAILLVMRPQSYYVQICVAFPSVFQHGQEKEEDHSKGREHTPPPLRPSTPSPSSIQIWGCGPRRRYLYVSERFRRWMTRKERVPLMEL
ncbi:hypothetical protein B0H19DRAFT_284911 [Mycena capillaripes]|nr:hypothetical protein B0H19DRAFT_284911 [Mycena capillaripes]